MKKIYSYGFGAAIAAAFLCATFSAYAAVPAVINYQSRLRTSAGAAITTATKVQFSLYSTATGGSAVWTESYSLSSGACAKFTPDSNGYFSAQMGSCDAFPATLTFTTPLYLGVKIENDAEAMPRVVFAPAPYAMNAVRVGNFVSDTVANTLTGEPAGTATAGAQGFHSSGLALQGSGWSGSVAQNKGFKVRTTVTDASNYRLSVLDSTSGLESISILNNGRVGIGITTPQSELEVAGIIYANDFRTRGGSISTTGDGTNDLIRFTRPKLLIGHTADLNVVGPITNLMQFTASDVTFLEDASFNKLISIPSRKIKFGANTFTFPVAAPATDGLVLTTDTDGTLSWASSSSGGGGTVSSVGLSAPTDFTVSGTPVTDTGTLGFTWKTQQPNEIMAGPASGVAVGTPSFRALVAADIPSLSVDKITTGVFGAARGGTGLSTVGAAGTVLTSVGGVPAWAVIPASAGGTVTSVGFTAPSSILTVAGSPVTGAGTLAIDFATQSPNEVFIGPTDTPNAKPSFRSLVSADIPDLAASKITSGVFDAARIPVIASSSVPNLDASKITSGFFDIVRGGTGLTATLRGDILFSDAINSLARLGIGSTNQILTVNSAGLPVWQDASAAGVMSVGLTLPSLFTVSGSPVTASGTLSATLAAQARNIFFGGPVSGVDTAPGFRALDSLDIPDLSADKITSGVFSATRIPVIASSSVPDLDAGKITSGVFGTARGGTGLSTVGAAGTVLTSVGGVPAWTLPSAGIGGSGAFGQLAFWNASSTLTGNPRLIIDNTNNRLAIGTLVAPATTLVVGGDTTVGGDVVPSAASTYDFGSTSNPVRSVYSDNLGSATKRIKAAYIDELYIYGGAGGSGTSTISATQTVFNGITYTWPSPPIPGNDFALTTDTNGNLTWKNPTSLVPESGWRALGGNVRLGVISDKVGIGMAIPAEKLDVIGNIQASGLLSSGSGQIKFGGATYSFPTTLPSSGQILSASSTAGSLVWQTPTSGLGGSGTANYIPLWNGTSTIGNSLISQFGQNMTIGVGADNQIHLGGDSTNIIIIAGNVRPSIPGDSIKIYGAMDVYGAMGVSGILKLTLGAGAGKVLTSDAIGNATWQTPAGGTSGWVSAAGKVTLATSTDSVGIGTATPNNKLQVAGLVNFDDALSAISLGTQAGQSNTGVSNIFLGRLAGFANTAGSQNVFLGDRSGANNVTGSNNIAIGASAMVSATGNSNIGIGSLAIERNTGGSNIAIGGQAMRFSTVGADNTAIGIGAMDNNLGSRNVALGAGTGRTGISSITTADSVFIGHSAGPQNTSMVNVVAIGSGVKATQDNQVVIGNVLTTQTLLRGIESDKLKITGGVLGVGKVLTSDNLGNATWQTAASGSPASAASNTVLAGPIGAAGAPEFRALTALDIPALDTTKLTTGTLPVTRGGTGLSSVGSAGQVLTVVNGVPGWQAPASGALNLSAVNQDILPDVNDQRSIGNATNRFLNGYFSGRVNANVGITVGGIYFPVSAGAGKVLTSDASGNAAWTAPVSGLPAIGTSGQVLTVASGVATWVTPVGELATFTGNKTISGSLAVQGGATGTGRTSGLSLGATAGTQAYVYRDSARSVVIDTDGTGAAGNNGTITLSGDSVLIGRPNSTNLNFIQLGAKTTDVIEVVGALKVGAANTQYTFPYDNGGAAGKVLSTIDGSGALGWQTLAQLSDARLKENIVPLKNALDIVRNITGIKYDWTKASSQDTTRRQIGFVAQNVEEFAPELVETGADGYKRVDYMKYIPVLNEGIKALYAEQQKIKAQADALEDAVLTGAGTIEVGKNAIMVMTSKASDVVKIFITPVGSTGGQVLYVGDIVDGNYFTVKTDKAVRAPVRFNWMVIE